MTSTDHKIKQALEERQEDHFYERMVLASFARYGDPTLFHALTPEDFSNEQYRETFMSMKTYWRMFKNNEPLGIHSALKSKQWYKDAGEISWFSISFIEPEGTRGLEALHMEQLVKELRKRRSARKMGEISSTLDRVTPGNVVESVVALKKKTAEVVDLLPSSEDLSIKAMGGKLKDRSVVQTKLGFSRMDDALGGGPSAGTLFVVAARPGVGKTTMALNIAAHAVARGQRVLFVSLEMNREDIAERFLCCAAGAQMWEVRKETTEIIKALKGDLYIADDRYTLTGIQESFFEGYGCDLFIVDYLQLITTGKNVSRIQELTEITRELKMVAKSMDKPIILCAQLNRNIEKDRQNREPILSDIRDTGTLEQDADYVTFLWDKNAKETEGKEVGELASELGADEQKSDIRWILRKNRYGKPNCHFKMDFDAKRYSFTHIT